MHNLQDFGVVRVRPHADVGPHDPYIITVQSRLEPLDNICRLAERLRYHQERFLPVEGCGNVLCAGFWVRQPMSNDRELLIRVKSFNVVSCHLEFFGVSSSVLSTDEHKMSRGWVSRATTEPRS